MHNPGSRGYILKNFGIMLSKELTLMSSKSVKSVLGSQNIADVKTFSWSKVLDVRLMP